MKFPKLQSCCLAALLVGTGVNADTMPDAGQDKRVEWKIQQTWPTAGKTLAMVNSLDGKLVFFLNDKQQVQIYSTQGQLQGSIPVEEGVSSIDIAPQGETLYLINNTNQSFTSVAVSFVVDVDTTGAPFKGPSDAPVTITLFTDFECPYCRQIIPLLDEILERNPKNVKLSFKNLPLKFHKFAEPSAKAALAANEQGKFWAFHDRLFAETKLTEESIKKTAVEVKLDIPRFEKDMESPKIQSMLQKDILDAQSAGVTGTPTIFINGRTPRQRSLEGLQVIIDDELQKLGKK
ncbi:MAG: thioredoxin domain-containing protein [Proteobacteria bacterium]|nr:thioredoxin domain-containing protein [Pseudomonadota bacterium]